MKMRFRVGDTVALTDSAKENECYAEFRDQILVVSDIATAYMPAKEFFGKGKPKGFHPGFDPSVNCALYDCLGINVSLYDWELKHAYQTHQEAA